MYIWRLSHGSQYSRISVIHIQKTSATRTVVSIEMPYLFSNMKDTISNLKYKIVEAGEDAAFT